VDHETLYAEIADGVAVITINRPDARNAVNRQVQLDIRGALDAFRCDDPVAVVVFTGARTQAFVAGADIAQVRQIGLVTSVVPGAELPDRAREVAGQIMAKGPLAIRLATLVIRSGMDTDQRTGLAVERLAQALLHTADDKAEAPTRFWPNADPCSRGDDHD